MFLKKKKKDTVNTLSKQKKIFYIYINNSAAVFLINRINMFDAYCSINDFKD